MNIDNIIKKAHSESTEEAEFLLARFEAYNRMKDTIRRSFQNNNHHEPVDFNYKSARYRVSPNTITVTRYSDRSGQFVRVKEQEAYEVIEWLCSSQPSPSVFF